MARLCALGLSLLCLAGAPAAVGDGFWHTDGDRIKDAAGNIVRFSGVNWHGMDSENLIPHGLWGGTGRTIEAHLDEMKASGFSLIRLPFSSEIFLPGQKPKASAIDPVVNASLLGLTCLEVLDRIVASAGARGIRIILDYHRLKAGSASEGGHWYDAEHSEAQWIANWKVLAARYKTNPTVVGADLFNEVHNGVTWEADNVNVAHNWRWAAKRCANEILSIHPDWLICVQGLDTYKGEGGWWGAVHLGVKDHPLTLNVANRLVYQIHDYGPIVWDQPFHQAATFPSNLPGHWDHQWGFLHNEGIAPVWVGEWGSFLDASKPKGDRELQWFGALRDYIAAKQLSWTWWCWTPESHDTGGILKDDYSGVNTSKVSALAGVVYPAFGASSTAGGGGTTTPPSGQTAYGGTTRVVPGTVQAEDFDEGGEGVAYHDSDTTNSGGTYRTTGVDVEACSDAGGGHNVGWLAGGEWLEYTVNVATAGSYRLDVRVASASGGGSLHLEQGGLNLTGTLAAPVTGGWQTWTTVSKEGVELASGPQVLRLSFDSGSFNVNWFALTLTAASPVPDSGTGTAGGGSGGGSDNANCGLLGIECLAALLLLRFLRRKGDISASQKYHPCDAETSPAP